jgi:hypothetical protein
METLWKYGVDSCGPPYGTVGVSVVSIHTCSAERFRFADVSYTLRST